jgi:hypothetical protein
VRLTVDGSRVFKGITIIGIALECINEAFVHLSALFLI